MVLLGTVIEGKFRMHLYRDGEIDIEFEPKDYTPQFFEIMKRKSYFVRADLDIITSGKADIRNFILNGEYKAKKRGEE